MKDLATLGDDDLLDLLIKGEKSAFEVIYDRYWERLYFMAYKRLRSAVAAEEVVQNIFIILWQKREGLSIASLPHYLSAMVRHAVYRWLTNEARRTGLHQDAQTTTTQFSTDVSLDHKQLLEIIDKLSCTLPEKCRLVFRANKLHDQPLAEVARELNISPKTAEAHLTKALRLIRGNLGRALHFLALLF